MPDLSTVRSTGTTPSVGGYLLGGIVAVALGSVLIGTVLLVWSEKFFTVAGFVGAVATVGAAALVVALALGAPTATWWARSPQC